MLKELWVTIQVYLLKGNPLTCSAPEGKVTKKLGLEKLEGKRKKLTTGVGRVGWPLVQMGCFKPKAGQLPQKRPAPQSVAAEHASETCQIQFNSE